MKAVLYTEDMEPITVIDVPLSLWQQMERGLVVRFCIHNSPKLAANYTPPEKETMRYVQVFGEILERRGKKHLMLFTRDEEFAMLLKAAFLPGQYGEVHARQRDARVQGFLQAIRNYGG